MTQSLYKAQPCHIQSVEAPLLYNLKYDTLSSVSENLCSISSIAGLLVVCCFQLSKPDVEMTFDLTITGAILIQVQSVTCLVLTLAGEKAFDLGR